jgi:hypothetical protein
MGMQSVLGLTFPRTYRDAEWIRATWWGNDWVTLIIAVPLLITAARRSRRGLVRGSLVWFGTLGYATYNYAYYLFGAALNAFFPLYVLLLVLSLVTLILALSPVDVNEFASHVRSTACVRLIGGYYTFIGIGLASVWLAMWAAYVFAGRPTPVEPEAFKLVAALDLSVMATSLVLGGILLWRRHPWGYVIAAISGVQSSLYLMVLTVNSAVAIHRGLVSTPGELPLWGALAGLTTVVTLVLLANVDSRAFSRRERTPTAEHAC